MICPECGSPLISMISEQYNAIDNSTVKIYKCEICDCFWQVISKEMISILKHGETRLPNNPSLRLGKGEKR